MNSATTGNPDVEGTFTAPVVAHLIGIVPITLSSAVKPVALLAPTPTPTPTATPAPPPPHVTGIVQSGSSSAGLTALSITFDEALNAVAASNTSLFQVLGGVTKHHKNVFTKGLQFKAAAYNPATHTVTLNLAKPYKGPVQVTVDAGIASSQGVPSKAGLTEVVA
jgi:hypothetical protein